MNTLEGIKSGFPSAEELSKESNLYERRRLINTSKNLLGIIKEAGHRGKNSISFTAHHEFEKLGVLKILPFLNSKGYDIDVESWEEEGYEGVNKFTISWR